MKIVKKISYVKTGGTCKKKLIKKNQEGGYTRPVVNKELLLQGLAEGKSKDEILNIQNERQKDFAKYWYKERAKQSKYQEQLGGGNLEKVLKQIDNSTYVPPRELLADLTRDQFIKKLGREPTEGDKQQLAKDYSTRFDGFIAPDNKRWSVFKAMGKNSMSNTWHEGIGHAVGDAIPEILDAADLHIERLYPSDNPSVQSVHESWDEYRNQPNEKHAETWGFRGANINLKDDKGNYYIDPNRQLNGKDVEEMIKKGAIIPRQFQGMTPGEIAHRHNTFAYNPRKTNTYYG